MAKAKPFNIPKREVWEAFKKVKANQGAAGVDGQTIAEFEADLPTTSTGSGIACPQGALSHLAFLLLITYLRAGLGFNRFNGLGSR